MSGARRSEREVLRQRARAWRRSMGSEESRASSREVRARLQGAGWVGRDAVVLAYAAAKENEVELGPLIDHWIESGVRVAVPETSSGAIVAREIRDRGALRRVHFGLLEPSPEAHGEIERAVISVILIPGIAFDRKGGRLGFGGGYYDRYLDGWDGGLRIGVAHDGQLVESIARQPHDVAMDWVVSAGGLWRCATSEPEGSGGDER